MTWEAIIRVHAAARRALLPGSFAAAGLVLMTTALLLADRGAEPGLVARSGGAPFGTLQGAITAAVGLSVTWAGMALAAVVVGWTIGVDLEQGVEHSYRQAGVSLGARLGASACWFLVLDALVTAALAGALLLVGRQLDGWFPPTGVPPVVLTPRLLLVWFVGTSCWWSASASLCLLLRSSTAALATLTGLVVLGLLLANRPALAPWLPTVWLGALVGFEPGGSRLTDLWSDGASVLPVDWAAPTDDVALVLVAGITVLALAVVVVLARNLPAVSETA